MEKHYFVAFGNGANMSHGPHNRTYANELCGITKNNGYTPHLYEAHEIQDVWDFPKLKILPQHVASLLYQIGPALGVVTVLTDNVTLAVELDGSISVELQGGHSRCEAYPNWQAFKTTYKLE